MSYKQIVLKCNCRRHLAALPQFEIQEASKLISDGLDVPNLVDLFQ
jgi:hypothetical protein